MGLSGLATAVGLFALALGRTAAWLSYPTLWWTIWVVKSLARVPGASMEVKLPPAGLAAIYLFLLVMTVRPPRWDGLAHLRRRFATRWAVGVSLAAAAVSVITAVSVIRGLPDGQLHITFLDVGEGEAILVRSPEGRRILIDGGPDPAVLLSHLGRELSFWERSLDLVIATHPDREHVNGLPAVLERYRVEKVITNGERDGPASWIELLAQVEAREISHVIALRGQTISTGDGVTLEVLHPDDRPGERFDENAIVLRLRYGDAAFMLTADAGKEVESELIEAELPLQSTVLKVADSGDRDGTSWAFLEAVTPELIVFSVGDPVGNPNRHPAVRVLERVEAWNCTVVRTDLQGSIHLTTDGDELWVETDR
jgi:competence protein ComEC